MESIKTWHGLSGGPAGLLQAQGLFWILSVSSRGGLEERSRILYEFTGYPTVHAKHIVVFVPKVLIWYSHLKALSFNLSLAILPRTRTSHIDFLISLSCRLKSNYKNLTSLQLNEPLASPDSNLISPSHMLLSYFIANIMSCAAICIWTPNYFVSASCPKAMLKLGNE